MLVRHIRSLLWCINRGLFTELYWSRGHSRNAFKSTSQVQVKINPRMGFWQQALNHVRTNQIWDKRVERLYGRERVCFEVARSGWWSYIKYCATNISFRITGASGNIVQICMNEPEQLQWKNRRVRAFVPTVRFFSTFNRFCIIPYHSG